MVALQKSRFTIALITIPLLLLIPLVAMQFTAEVNWSPLDFLVMAVLLASSFALLEGVFRVVKKRKQRIVLALVVLAAFLLLWAELAVGIFGTPFAGS